MASLTSLALGCATASDLPTLRNESGRRDTPPSCAPDHPHFDTLCREPQLVLDALRTHPLQILEMQDTMHGKGGAARLVAAVRIGDDEEKTVLSLKGKVVPDSGEGYNNQPRKNIAAHALSWMLFPPGERPVPLTALRCLPLDAFPMRTRRAEGPRVELPRFRDSKCVMMLLQLWLSDVKGVDDLPSPTTPAERSARGRLRLFAYLIDHRDTNAANFVRRAAPSPMYFSLDHEFTFSGVLGNPLPIIFATDWSTLDPRAIPTVMVVRLAALERARFRSLLSLVELELVDGVYRQRAPSAPLDPEKGVRIRGDVLQMGLTADEVDAVVDRLGQVLRTVAALPRDEP